MGKVTIDKIKDIIIIEKSNRNDILKGSKLFCGCCGNILGELSKKITFPFNSNDLNKVVKNKTYEIMLFGLRHKTCGHSMFSFRKEYGFVALKNYIKEVERVAPTADKDMAVGMGLIAAHKINNSKK